MFCKKIQLEFICGKEDMLSLLERPYPAIQNTPEWFKHCERYVNGIKDIDSFSDPNSTIKKCMPVVDMIGTGYHIPLYSDVWLENAGEDNLSFKWSWDTLEIVSIQKPEQYTKYPIPFGYYNTVFKWINPWTVKTPPGWSCLFVHPQHHEELPFRSLSALVDTDKHPIPVHLPFFLRKGFDGLIPKGTPMIQIIPFKREHFTSSFSWDKGNLLKTAWTKAHTVFFERYQKFFRSAKTYEQGSEKKSKCPLGF
jgi:hypothetical protein